MKNLEKLNQVLYVSLGSQLDTERFMQYSKSEQFEELQKPRDFVYYQIKSLKEASELCRKFIEKYRLGGSSWTGGRVVDEDNNFVAWVSYNGRVWESESYPSKEITI